MKTISLAVSEEEYEQFHKVAREKQVSFAHLMREAMAHYRATVLEGKPRLRRLPVFPGHRLVAPLPERCEIEDDIFSGRGT